MKKICSILITLSSLTYIANAQTFDPVLATKLQNKIDSSQGKEEALRNFNLYDVALFTKRRWWNFTCS